MTAIDYLIQARREQQPHPTDWLTAREQLTLAGLTVPKRRSDWLLGRWTAKRALATRFDIDVSLEGLARIEILAAADGAPEAFLDGQRAEVVISISHSADRAICAIAGAGTKLGCDLEQIEKRSDELIETFFTPSEQALCEQADAPRLALLATLIWSAKESALKAIRQGLRLDTRTVEVHPDLTVDRSWRAVAVRRAGAHRPMLGWWMRDHDFIVCVIAEPEPEMPVSLAKVPGPAADR